jgi:hypothetical protein
MYRDRQIALFFITKMVMMRVLLLLGLQLAALGAASARWEPAHERVLRTVVHPGATAETVASWDAAAANLSMPLDHFDALSPKRWQMRYWVNDQYWDGSASAPAFLCMGGEGASGPPGGAAGELAKEYRGLAFSVEHRYYGKSIPTEDFSTANLRWLGTEQALADAASFVRSMNERYNLTSSRWISFGGSYSGELAAWVRIKYPHLIYGAIASSAPVSGEKTSTSTFLLDFLMENAEFSRRIYQDEFTKTGL